MTTPERSWYVFNNVSFFAYKETTLTNENENSLKNSGTKLQFLKVYGIYGYPRRKMLAVFVKC